MAEIGFLLELICFIQLHPRWDRVTQHKGVFRVRFVYICTILSF